MTKGITFISPNRNKMKTFTTLLKDQLKANGYTLAEFRKGWDSKKSPSWKRGYASAHGLLYGSYIESQVWKSL